MGGDHTKGRLVWFFVYVCACFHEWNIISETKIVHKPCVSQRIVVQGNLV